MIKLFKNKWFDGALILGVTVLMIVTLRAIFIQAPMEKIMGAVQKVFYFHVPLALVTYLGVACLLGFSIAYLWTRNIVWEAWSKASTEISLLFCTLVLVTGPIWAKPAWGTWWTWEARLTTTLILWILLAAALLIRNVADSQERGAKFAAVVGILAAIDIPIIHKAVEWWRGQHPTVFKAGNRGALDPEMVPAFALGMLVFFVLFIVLLLLRARVAVLEDEVRAAQEQLWMEDSP